jgi:hypothetical protein
MSTLRIAFSGLCTFAFTGRPLKGEGDPPTEVVVLLQRLTRARSLSNAASARSEVLDQHFPLLEFKLNDFNPASTRKADVHCRPDADGDMTKGICYLNGEELTIFLDGRPMRSDSLDLSRKRPANPEALNLTQEERDSLWWMATLQDVFPGNPRINPKILEVQPGSNQPVLARVKLSEGTLRTLELTDAPCTVVGSSSSSFNQRVGTSFELAIDFEHTVEIEMVSNRNGKREKKRLVLWGPRRKGDLQIGIMNMEIDRVMGVDPASGPRPEADFSVYADILQDRVEGPIPFLRQTFPGSPAGNATSTCVPGGG